MRYIVTVVIALTVTAVSPLFADDVQIVDPTESRKSVDPKRIAELVEKLENGGFTESIQYLTEIQQLLRDNPGTEEEFVPLVNQLLRRSGFGGIARGNSEQAEAIIVAIGSPSRPYMIQQLASRDDRERRVAVQVLFQIGPSDADLVILMRPLLTDNGRFVRGAVLDGFRLMGPLAKDAITDLEHVAATDRFLPWRVRASEALIYVDGASKERIQVLAEFTKLEEPCENANRDAIDAIARLGEEAQFLESMLIAALKRPDVRGSAAAALGAIRAKSPEAVTSLAEILRNDSNLEVRRTAAAALGKFGPRSQMAIPALQLVLAELQNGEGWYVAATSLSEIGGPEVVPILIESLVHPDADVRLASIKGLGHLGTVATPAIAALERASQTDERPLNRSHALTALELIRKQSP